MGGFCFAASKEPQQPAQKTTAQVDNVDVVKVKLKQARDRIKNFINSKNKDIASIDNQIAQKLPKFKQTGNKKELVPLLKAKKDLQKMAESGQVRLKLVNQKLDEVQMQKMNAETISVLDESNQYIQTIQRQLEQRDWRKVLDQAQNKYQIEWPDDSEEVQADPAFQKMWDEIGGNKLAPNKVPEKKIVNVNTQEQPNVVAHQKKQMTA